ncbi:BMP family ABC transporter substrate-binding protein [Virgibacillus dakarensis]|uniref:BMP family ABC transporter substrate-binding protein n=1 Tax=Virgibacillus dakarensis TaxID=1917889 RepID=UPI000B438B4F|nr:BMP family ABC transporter substrate-binding protein [Virgibacillus dakarensis]MTW85422.1 BMP family ABC transporter substrate-binding protein [Virgibacillus dakarensis]
MHTLEKRYIIILIGFIILLSGCSSYFDQGKIQKAGMLAETSIHDQAWGAKGYKGLLAIRDKYDVDVYFKEGIKTEQDVANAVDELVNHGVNLIFGHSSAYGKFFVDISQEYPDVQFVYFNGGYYADNVISLNFNAHAMGYFGGMIAGKMTKTNQVAIVAAYEWQPEIEGFYEGVKYQNPDAEVHIDYVNDWNDEKSALESFEKMRDVNADVIYPAGDAFSSEMIKLASKDGIYAIGYVSDQSDIDKTAVLTSTVQHADKLYELIAKKFNKGELSGQILTFDFQDDAISLGRFSPVVPEEFQEKIKDAIDVYKKTGMLPNER